MATNPKFTLESNFVVDAVFIKGDRVIVKEMTLAEFKAIPRKKDWQYKNFQKGAHSYKSTEDVQTKKM